MSAALVPLAHLLASHRPGSHDAPWTWADEFDDLWGREPERMEEIASSIFEDGILTPILPGSDGRIWDGHHRIVAAMAMGLEEVPIYTLDDWA